MKGLSKGAQLGAWSVSKTALLGLILLFAITSAKDYFKDDIEDVDGAFKRWIEPKPEAFNPEGAENDHQHTCNLERVGHHWDYGSCFCGGIGLTEEAKKTRDRFAISTNSLSEQWDTEGEDVIFQFSMGAPLDVQCASAEINLLTVEEGEEFDPETFSPDTPYSVSIKYDRWAGKASWDIYLRRYGEVFKLKKNITAEPNRYLSTNYRLIIRNDKYFDFVKYHDIQAQGDIDEDFELVGKKMEDLPRETQDNLFHGIGLGKIGGIGISGGHNGPRGTDGDGSDMVFSYLHLTTDLNAANDYQGWFFYMLNNRIEFAHKTHNTIDKEGNVIPPEETHKYMVEDWVERHPEDREYFANILDGEEGVEKEIGEGDNVGEEVKKEEAVPEDL